MAEAVETHNGSLQYDNTLDPISLLLHQISNSLTTTTEEDYSMERGPRYTEYAQLRERKLRKRQQQLQHQLVDEDYEEPKRSPLKKQVRFQGNLVTTNSRKGSSSVLVAQSVPDFSATLRSKENRKPAELTPPPSSKNLSRLNGGGGGVFSNSRGSKSANGGDKKGFMARKSYASVEDLKGFSMGVAKDICGDNRSRTGRVSKTILGTRQF